MGIIVYNKLTSLWLTEKNFCCFRCHKHTALDISAQSFIETKIEIKSVSYKFPSWHFKMSINL